jgi:hypothetical protein
MEGTVEIQTNKPEVYSEKYILFLVREDKDKDSDFGSPIIFAMTEYRAGKGLPPAIGQEMALDVYFPEKNPILRGIYKVNDVKEDSLDSPIVKPEAGGFWGVEVSKVRDLEHTDTANIERASTVGLI